VPQAGNRAGIDGKLEGLQALRGVAVLLVLLLHLATIEQKYGGRRLLPDLASVGAAGVDLFFVISGFVMASIMRGGFRGFPAAARFLGRRAARIYPLYWFYTAIVLLVFLARPAWVNASQGGKFDLPASVLLLPMDGLPVLMVGWTLVHEMYFYGVMALCLWLLPEKRFAAALLVWAVAAAAGWRFLGPDSGPWIAVWTSPLTLEFIAGALLGLFFRRPRQGFGGAEWGMAASGAALLAGYAAFARQTGRFMLEPAERAILFGAPMACLVFFLMVREQRSRIRPPRWLVAIGDASYSIYLSHVLVLAALGRLWSAFRSEAWWANAVALGLLAAGTVAAGLASYAWLERPWLLRARALAILASPSARMPPAASGGEERVS
jgi:exopolysaccharide production protein ExoZ